MTERRILIHQNLRNSVLGAPPLLCQYRYVDGSDHPILEPPQDPGALGYCLSVRRQPLDHLLMQRARATGQVDLAEKTNVTDLIWQAERVYGVRLATEHGTRSINAKLVVGADGRNSFVARAVQAAVEEGEPGHRALYYCYLQDFPTLFDKPADGPEFSQIEDEIAYLFPSDAGVTCLALSVNLLDFAWLKTDLSSRFRQRMAQHAGFASRLAHATPRSLADGQIAVGLSRILPRQFGTLVATVWLSGGWTAIAATSLPPTHRQR